MKVSRRDLSEVLQKGLEKEGFYIDSVQADAVALHLDQIDEMPGDGFVTVSPNQITTQEIKKGLVGGSLFDDSYVERAAKIVKAKLSPMAPFSRASALATGACFAVPVEWISVGAWGVITLPSLEAIIGGLAAVGGLVTNIFSKPRSGFNGNEMNSIIYFRQPDPHALTFTIQRDPFKDLTSKATAEVASEQEPADTPKTLEASAPSRDDTPSLPPRKTAGRRRSKKGSKRRKRRRYSEKRLVKLLEKTNGNVYAAAKYLGADPSVLYYRIRTAPPGSPLAKYKPRHVSDETILATLREMDGNRSRTARELGLSRRTIRLRIRESENSELKAYWKIRINGRPRLKPLEEPAQLSR